MSILRRTLSGVSVQRHQYVRAGAGMLGWGAVLLLASYFVAAFGLRYFGVGAEPIDPGWPKRGWLLVHICAGALALFTGPAQFWTGLRRRYRRLHRWTGRLYLSGVAVGTVTAVGLLPHVTFGWGQQVAAATMATVWFTTSLLAYVAVRRGRTKAHKDWVVRSYVMTFQFVALRILLKLPLLAGLGESPAERLTTLVWVSWVLPLFFTEVVLQWRNTVGREPARRSRPAMQQV